MRESIGGSFGASGATAVGAALERPATPQMPPELQLRPSVAESHIFSFSGHTTLTLGCRNDSMASADAGAGAAAAAVLSVVGGCQQQAALGTLTC